MLREIGPGRADGHGLRRWFQDDYFDLYVWQDRSGSPSAFQLCYDRQHAEGAIGWSAREGYMHARVDAGRQAGGHPMTPIHRTAAPPPYFRVYARFLQSTQDWDPVMRAFVQARLREYRWHLFGSRRIPRRRGGARS
jgi:hypothetical protein